MKPRLSVILAVVLLVLSGCEPVAPLRDNSGVRVASDAEVAGCTLLSTVTTTTGVFGEVVQEKALELARNDTLEEVRVAGGDTAVFDSGLPGSDDLFVQARAYKCRG